MNALRYATFIVVVCGLAVLGIGGVHAQCPGDPPIGNIACGNPGGAMVTPTDGTLEANFSLIAASRFAEISAKWWLFRSRVAPGAPLAAVREPRWATTSTVRGRTGLAAIR